MCVTKCIDVDGRREQEMKQSHMEGEEAANAVLRVGHGCRVFFLDVGHRGNHRKREGVASSSLGNRQFQPTDEEEA